MEEIIIKKCTNQPLTSAEELQLDRWLKENPKNKVIFAQMRLALLYPDSKKRNELKKEVWEKIMSGMPPLERGHSSKPNFGIWYKVAAAIVFCLSIAFASYFFKSYPGQDQKNAAHLQTETVENASLPGQMVTTILPDGTVVTLNSASRILVQENFKGDIRAVTLYGEAYFKVARDEARPFVVYSKGIKTTALGTEFDVRAYDDESVSVALVTGKVKVAVVDNTREELPGSDDIILTPGEGAKLNRDKTISKFSFDEKEYVAWINGDLYFSNATEDEVIRKLERWYNVKFRIENEAPRKWGYTGEFHRKSLEEVLLSLGFAMEFEFKMDSNTVVVKYNHEKAAQ